MGSVTCSKCFRESIFTGWEMDDGLPVCKDCIEDMELYEIFNKI